MTRIRAAWHALGAVVLLVWSKVHPKKPEVHALSRLDLVKERYASGEIADIAALEKAIAYELEVEAHEVKLTLGPGETLHLRQDAPMSITPYDVRSDPAAAHRKLEREQAAADHQTMLRSIQAMQDTVHYLQEAETSWRWYNREDMV